MVNKAAIVVAQRYDLSAVIRLMVPLNVCQAVW